MKISVGAGAWDGVGHQKVLLAEGAVWVWNPAVLSTLLAFMTSLGNTFQVSLWRTAPALAPGAVNPFLPLSHKGGQAQDPSLLHG